MKAKISQCGVRWKRQEQNPRYAVMREPMRNDIVGSKFGKKAYGFGYIGTDEKLFVFESPIDLFVLYHPQFRKTGKSMVIFPGRGLVKNQWEQSLGSINLLGLSIYAWMW